ncbi:MAG TPA: 2-oxoglutarate and iron-dependent oxygenase domain-containing protein [Reyranella sp.]|nr:2-oxoglutarate and iron-dependent oxygenase domain-containing protein [Reyranella sp.]
MSDVQTAATAPVAPPMPAPRLGRWANANELPVIDFAPLGGNNEEAKERVAREVHDACRDIGFLTIVNHPVPHEKIAEIFRQSKRFFALPLEDKMSAYMGHSNLFRGYLPMDQPGQKRAYRGKAIDGFQPHLAEARMKARKPHKNEAFQASIELPDDDPDVLAGKPLHGKNLWPANLPGFKEGVLDYHTTMTQFAALVASVFARGLKLPPDYFAQFYRKPLIQVRLLHYLPQETQAALEGGDSRAHQDAGGFTMLQQDDVGGLEIKSKSGEWLIVPPVENSFVVNIGDSMRMWTNNRFASTLHRVVNHYGRERYSVGIFANPDYDTVIRPLSTCVDAEHPPTFDQMLSGEALLFLYSRVWPSLGEPDKVSTY